MKAVQTKVDVKPTLIVQLVTVASCELKNDYYLAKRRDSASEV